MVATEFGFVPHLASSGRIGPFPENRRILASFRLTASRAFYATPKPTGIRIQLNLSHLPEGTRIAGLPDHPCDASCGKTPPDASQNSAHVRNQLKMRILKPRV